MHSISSHSVCLLIVCIIVSMEASIATKEGCPSHCGNVSIPYPFGVTTKEGCSLNSTYDVVCNSSFNPPKPFIVGLDYSGDESVLEILEISDTQIRIRNPGVAFMCFNSSGEITTNSSSAQVSLMSTTLIGSPISLSPDSNKLMTIGCMVRSGFWYEQNFTPIGPIIGSCKPACSSKGEVVVAGQCNGNGCCQTPIHRGLSSIYVAKDMGLDQSNYTDLVSFNRCGYAFLAEDGWYIFGGVSDLNDPKFYKRVMESVHVALDWVIGDGTCDDALINPSRYACMGNTTCSDQDQLESGMTGYNCFCRSGFKGNPYLSLGCSDIDECADPRLNNCSMVCDNTIGSFRCSCPRGYTGDGWKAGTGCTKKISQNVALIKLVLGVTSGFLFLVVGFSWLYIMDKKRKLIKIKKKFFQQNGGWLLKERLSMANYAGSTDPTKIFTEEELKRATNNFHKDQVLGNGGYGTVYKGVLPDNRVVAIKKSKVVDENQIEQFINEVVILSQINHRNVVKLLGCCLETQVPLLVYEFISNGTLYSHIHDEQNGREERRITWKDCLRIASEAADAITYLHSAASPPIIHRDIKSMNILLDDNYTAKIADFGASRLIRMDQSQLSTLVEGTLGYLDPEYFQSSWLTHKSDVYSFGVVLAELLTKQKPVSVFRSEENRNLATYFVRSMEQETLHEILDPQWESEASMLEVVSMASIAQRCLRLCGRDRPTMREISMELEALMKLGK